MTSFTMVTAGFQIEVAVLPGPLLLRGVGTDPSLHVHRRRWREPGRVAADRLIAETKRGRIGGRGGADFPFWRKLQVAVQSGRRRELVVNGSEGEPASAKDSTLLSAVPHLVLDGAELVAGALGVDVIHLMIGGERPAVISSVQRAIDERSAGRRPISFEVHRTTSGYVGGQARAVLELLSGRENLPVTSRQPEAVSGLRGRPTLISNAETFAQVAALHAIGERNYAGLGTANEPGTRLLSVAADGTGGVVLEVPHGEPLVNVLRRCGHRTGQPVLMGGYQGTWLSGDQADHCAISPASLRGSGARLGAGVILPMPVGECPVPYTAQVVSYLAKQRAQRCGPCNLGLPALAEACEQLARTGRAKRSAGELARVRELSGLVTGRGACAHPDGTARLVLSMLNTFPGEVAAHEHGSCLI